MIHIHRWNEATHRTLEITPADLPATAVELPENCVVWVDLENPTAEEEAWALKQFLPVHALSLEDATKLRREPEQGSHHSKVEEFPDYLFVIVNPLPPALVDKSPEKQPMSRKLVRPQLSSFLNHRVLVTHHYMPLSCIDQLKAYTHRHADCAGRGPDYLLHLILDSMVDEYAQVVEGLADKLDAIENRLFRKPTPNLLIYLLRIKRRVSYLRKTLILEREVLARLCRGEFALVEQREIAYYRNVYDHLVRYAELVESSREMVSDLMQTHLSAASMKLNEVMKVLTMISTIILPMTLIAGIYGMNFVNLPEKDWEYGYPFSLGLMAITATVSLTLFRRKGWI